MSQYAGNARKARTEVDYDDHAKPTNTFFLAPNNNKHTGSNHTCSALERPDA